VRVAMVGRLAAQPLLLAGQTCRLGVERLLEAELFRAVPKPLLEVGLGPLDRVAQQHDELGVGRPLGGPLGGERVEQVVRAPLARDCRDAATGA
jgi:hypothetical protein